MLQESNSDLFGHRKGFLSAGVASGVRPSLPQTSEWMLPWAARATLLQRLVGGRAPSHLLQVGI